MSEKPEINYPTQWSYKIIARGEEEIRSAVSKLQHSEELELAFSNSSSKGTFTSMNCSTTVNNEDERLAIYRQLKTNPGIKMVL